MMNVDCMNPLENVYKNGEKTVIELNEIPYYDGDSYDLNDEKSFKQYMKNLEYVVRNSFEYRSLINYLRNIEGMNKCSVLNVVADVESKIKIELHHSPLTLYDICYAVYKKRENNNEPIDINDVAQEVMYLHYIGWVGLVPVCSTVHETIHNGYLFIPTNIVRGNYKAFVEAYYNYIDPETLDAIDAAERATQENMYNDRKEIFNNHQIYVNVKDSYTTNDEKQYKDSIKTHIDDVKSNKISKSGIIMCHIVDKSETSK